MKCPDCKAALEKTALVGFDESYRCSQCGGVLMAGWVVNRIASKPEDKLMIEPMNVGVDLGGGEGKCPRDEQLLVSVPESEAPAEVRCRKCLSCGHWWFGGNNIFGFRHAYQVKQNFVKVWRKKELTAFALPALVAAVLLVGLGASVALTKLPQNISTEASSVVDNLVITRGDGNNKAWVSFTSSSKIIYLEYRKIGDEVWTKVFVVPPEDGKYVVELQSVNDGQRYEVRIAERVWEF